MSNDPAPADWPERFVYMCNATQGAPVNIVPMVNAGAGRVVGMAILVGLSNPDKPTNGDRSNALLPAERLRDYGRSILGLDDKNMIILKGRTEYFSDWTDAFGKAAGLAKALNAAIVYNITGGSKPQAVGALLGQPADRDGSPAVSVISFGHDRQTRQLRIGASGQLSEELLPVTEGMTLDTFLLSVGFKENDSEGRKHNQTLIDKNHLAADAMEKQIAETSPALLRRLFAAFYKQVYNRDYRKDFTVNVASDCMDFFRPAIARLDKTHIENGGSISIGSRFDLEFLQGKWLEHVIYRRVTKLLAGRNDTEVACGVRFGSGRGGNDFSDFDLAVVAGDRMDLVEAKAYITAKGLHEAIAKLAHYREAVGGHAGAAWIVAPLLSKDQVSGAGMQTHAKDAGIGLLYGNTALDDLDNALKRSLGLR